MEKCEYTTGLVVVVVVTVITILTKKTTLSCGVTIW